MATEALTFSQWLADSTVAQATLTPAQRAALQAAWHFLQQRGRDYYSVRLLSHVLLHAGTGLKVAQRARLLGISRSAASAQQGVSSKEVVQAAQQRWAGRSHGKLLPRFAGPIAAFLHTHPAATRCDVLDFIRQTWDVSVSRMALYRFLKKYGLDQASHITALPRATAAPSAPPGAPTPAAPTLAVTVTEPVAPRTPVPLPPPAFFLPPPSTRGPSSSCPLPSAGSAAPRNVSRTPTARCGAAC